ncbi:hypothetical protein BaRGS_00002311, partial [Batillaria attramentaria]
MGSLFFSDKDHQGDGVQTDCYLLGQFVDDDLSRSSIIPPFHHAFCSELGQHTTRLTNFQQTAL